MKVFQGCENMVSCEIFFILWWVFFDGTPDRVKI